MNIFGLKAGLNEMVEAHVLATGQFPFDGDGAMRDKKQVAVIWFRQQLEESGVAFDGIAIVDGNNCDVFNFK